MAAENIDFSTLAYPETNWLDYMSTAANPGVYIAWERRSTSTIAFYQILRGPTLDGAFSTLLTTPFLHFNFVNSPGNPSLFIRLEKLLQTEQF